MEGWCKSASGGCVWCLGMENYICCVWDKDAEQRQITQYLYDLTAADSTGVPLQRPDTSCSCYCSELFRILLSPVQVQSCYLHTPSYLGDIRSSSLGISQGV